jgi:two-component system response regulator FixJ
VNTFASADEVLKAKPGTFSRGCFVVDVRMPGRLDGIDLLSELSAVGIDLPCLVMSGHADVPLAVRAMRQGAVDVVSKPYDADGLVDAVEAAIARATDRVLPAGDPFRAQARALISKLGQKELDVLRAVLGGESTKEIALNSGISFRTVENHRYNIRHKLKVDNWMDVQRLALAAGIKAKSYDNVMAAIPEVPSNSDLPEAALA